MNKGKILALDIGTKKTVLAISDIGQSVAFIRPEIFHNSDDDLILKVNKIISEENIKELLLGLPLSLSGEINLENRVYKIIKKIESEIKLPIKRIDERLSTKQAISRSSKNEEDDSQSALILLQNYLDIKA